MAQQPRGVDPGFVSTVITGAGGLIGRNLVAALERDGDVWALTRQAAGSGGRARWIEADLANPAFLDRLPEGVDTVVHLAQSPHYRDFPDQAGDVFNVNVASTAMLLDWSHRHGVRRFVFASAGGADRAGDGAPLSNYLAGKRAAELIAQSYAAQFSVTVLRFFFVYGKDQRRSMLMPRLVDAVRAGNPLTLAGPDGIRLNPTHVDDAVAAVRQAVIADRPGTFEIAGPEVMSMRQIGDVIGARVGRAPQFTIDQRGGTDLIGDISEMSAQLIAPRRRLADGIEDLL